MSKLAKMGSSISARTRWTIGALAVSAAILIGSAAAPGSRHVSPSTGARPAPKPHAASQVKREAANASAEVAARTFVSSYVSFLYGRRRSAAVTPVGGHLHQQLLRAQSTPTPAERTRALVVRDLTVSPDTTAGATGSAIVDDGAAPPYALSFNLSFSHRAWVVTDLRGGGR